MARSQRHKVIKLPDNQLTRAEELFPGSSDPDSTRALFAIRSLARRANESADSWLKPYGINAAKQNYLSVLAFSDNGLTLNEVSELIHTSNATVTLMVGQLEREGLVERHAHPEDGRKVILRLSAKGWRLFKRSYPIHHRNIEHAMSVISKTQRQQLWKTLLLLGQSFDEKFPPK